MTEPNWKPGWEDEREEGFTPVPTDLPALSEAQVRAALLRALVWVGVLAFAIASGLLLMYGWRTATMLLVGAAIAASGLWEWHRFILLIAARLDAAGQSGSAPGVARVVSGFLLRLLIAAAVIYSSLRSLHGSVFALMGGLALAVPSLGIEAGRLVRSSARTAG